MVGGAINAPCFFCFAAARVWPRAYMVEIHQNFVRVAARQRHSTAPLQNGATAPPNAITSPARAAGGCAEDTSYDRPRSFSGHACGPRG